LTATWHKVKNNAASELASAITSAANSLNLKTGEGSRFPAGFPYRITIDDEIMEVTARTDDILTVTRAQEGTSAASHNGGSAVRLNITAALIEELQAEIDTKEASLPLTAKGDLLGFATVLAKLPVGSDGQYLVADSGAETGLKWQTLSGGAVISSGSYTGNSSANRAIPHGLGVTPKLVMIFMPETGYTNTYEFILHEGASYIYYKEYQAVGGNYAKGGNPYTVTNMDSNNFYVGHSSSYEKAANSNSKVYYWVAIG
jgi:hypothetical protein